jgi:hypothetical protein
MRPFTVSSRMFPPPFALCHHLQPYLPHVGIPPRPPNRIVFTLHVPFSLSRVAHAHSATQGDRQSARLFLVMPQPPESFEVEPLGFPPRAWALQALPISGRGAEMVG